MPEKRYKKGCGPGCLRCWVNNLKHGNKESKAYLKKHPELDRAVHNISRKQPKKSVRSQNRKKIREQDAVCDDLKWYRNNNEDECFDDEIEELKEKKIQLHKELEGVEEYCLSADWKYEEYSYDSDDEDLKDL